MNLQFEEWVNKQHFSHPINVLFTEAITCYRSKAYRAALLFSFTGFQKVIKEKMLKSEIPRTYRDKIQGWASTLNEIRDDDKSDHKIISCVIQNKPDNTIFDLNEDVRNQYVYWKNRRNDCAHGKENIIDVSHVEAFWFFIQANLGKFSINGGKESLIHKIRNYLDINITPKSQSPDFLLEEIVVSITASEIGDVINLFIQEAMQDDLWELFESFEPKLTNLLIVSLKLPDVYLENYIQYLKNNLSVIRILAEQNSSILSYIDDNVIIRNLWRNKIYYKHYEYKSYPIMIAMLKYQLISNDTKPEFFEFCLTNYTASYFQKANSLDFQILNQSGFIEHVRNIAFVENKISNFEWSDKKKYLISFYLKYAQDIDEIVVTCLEDNFNKKHYPRYLGAQICHLQQTDAAVREKILLAFKKYGKDIPEYLK